MGASIDNGLTHPCNTSSGPRSLLWAPIVCMVVLAVATRDPVPSAATISRVPLWAWSGGTFGAIFIGLSIATVPKLGGAAYIALGRLQSCPQKSP